MKVFVITYHTQRAHLLRLGAANASRREEKMSHLIKMVNDLTSNEKLRKKKWSEKSTANDSQISHTLDDFKPELGGATWLEANHNWYNDISTQTTYKQVPTITNERRRLRNVISNELGSKCEQKCTESLVENLKSPVVASFPTFFSSIL